ncbi:glucoamylase family protein [Sphingobacterium chungjuense]|uniref:glucoamylase family protein n=1 Tax=Sphingobacterium chungjuense TaxID=2675553 RepID=UPI00140E6920|nr:glucoamylase family protein [Sphingobacterium chungjuense]
MKIAHLLLSIALLLGLTAHADTYPEVVFDNSLIMGVYAKSEIRSEGGSWIENVDKHLPVSDSIFFTPGNSLSLRYVNADGGNWEAAIKYSRQKYHYRISNKDVLVLKLYVHSDKTTSKQLPTLSIRQKNRDSDKVNLANFIEDYNVNTWLDVRIPIAKIRGLDVESAIKAVVLHQQGMGSHHIYIDQVEFLPANYSKVRLTSPAVLSKVTPYDRNIHLQWQLPLTPSIRYVKIYRSEDKKTFEPVSIRPISMQGGLDYVPALDKTYYYKIAWVDYDYKESPYSTILEVKPVKLADQQVFDLIQRSHVNYFVDNFDINSGMHTPFRQQGKTVVSTNETGLALLALLVGVERGYVSKNTFIHRVKRVVDFLESVPEKHGVFASYYDGRKKEPIYMDARPNYSVTATTTMLQSLLVVRQFLQGESDDEVYIRDKINKLWDNINWPALVMANTEDVLVADVGVLEELTEIKPLGGFNESMNTYILAAASTKNGISSSGFVNNLNYEYNTQNSLLTDSIDDFDSDLLQQNQRQLNATLESDMKDLDKALERQNMLRDTVLYGVRIPFGELNNRNLLSMYMPFLTIDPALANTADFAFGDVLKSYTEYVKRRDNESGRGTRNVAVWGYQSETDPRAISRINPAISVASVAVDYQKGLQALLTLYKEYGDILLTEYGFRAWIDLKNQDVSDEYLSINQASVAIMIENARSGLIWKLYREIPEIKAVQEKIFVQSSLN